MANEDLQELEEMIQARKKAETAVVEAPAAPVASVSISDVGGAIGDAKQKIIQKAAEKIQDEKLIEKHSDNIARISDLALEVEAEKQRLIVEEVNADNKVVAQEIKNRLIVLKAEAKRLEKEQKQLDKDQKAEHERRNKDAKWELYGDKLKKMKYDYVPCLFVLAMLLFFDGVKSFFDGLGAVSTAIAKALKWVLIGVLIIAVIMIIPVTREWLLSLLQFK
jgi:hypothetical protein